MYCVNDCLPYLHATCEEMCIETGLVDYWIELCAREGEPDGKHTPEQRVIALTFMNELWLTFTDYVDSNEDMVTTIIFMMKRAVRDRNRNLRLTCMG
jgi:hypothetical protein